MKYINFGKTNKEVSILGMGGMRFEKNITEKNCISFIRYASELGVNYFDTAPLYNEDRSEAIYGRAFKEMPTENFFIATKGDNAKPGRQIELSIENSLRKLQIERINFYFLWCVTNAKQFERSKMKGEALEAIVKAKERELIEHIGVSTHMYSDGIKQLVDSGIFEFIMIPYNALNFRQRDEGLRYAKEHQLGTVVMNPLYGGVIPQYKNIINIYPDSKNSPVEDAFRFCMESPFINVTLSGMNRIDMINENVSYALRSEKKSSLDFNLLQSKIQSANRWICTSCGYCMIHCPEEIDIMSYMEIYNTYMLTKSVYETKKRHEWYFEAGPLMNITKKTADCTQCQACENECTQYLDIIKRLEWISEQFEKNTN